MTVLKFLALFGFSVLLTGCVHYVCPAPGEPKFNNHHACWYGMKVVHIDERTGLVTAAISDGVGGEQVDHKKKYQFFVRDLPKGMTAKSIEGKDYIFVSDQGSPYLELFVVPPDAGSMKQ